MDPRAGVDVTAKRKMCPSRESNPNRKAHSQSLYKTCPVNSFHSRHRLHQDIFLIILTCGIFGTFYFLNIYSLFYFNLEGLPPSCFP